MIAKKRNDDDLVDTDIYRETNDEESENKDQIEESKEDNLESNKSETDERDQREHPETLKRFDIQKMGYGDDPVDTDINLETNVMKKHRIKYFYFGGETIDRNSR